MRGLSRYDGRMSNTREQMPTLPEDLSEYARVHTGPGSWSADTHFESIPPPRASDTATPHPPFVALREWFA